MILADAAFNEENGAQCLCKISGNAELIAIEYATLTKALIEAEGGQAVLDRAMDIMKGDNEHEEKRSK